MCRSKTVARQVKSVVPKKVYAPVMTKQAATAMAAATPTASAPASLRRVLKEYGSLVANPAEVRSFMTIHSRFGVIHWTFEQLLPLFSLILELIFRSDLSRDGVCSSRRKSRSNGRQCWR